MSGWIKKIQGWINGLIYPYQVVHLRDPFNPNSHDNRFEVEPSDLTHGFSDLGKAHRDLQNRVKERYGAGARLGDNVRLYTPQPFLEVPFEELFVTDEERVILETTKEILDRLSAIQFDLLEQNNPVYANTDWPTYLKSSAIRVLQLLHQFKKHHIISGSILEIGGLFGTFGLPLQRLGYQVTLVDRYASYSPALDAHCDWLEKQGLSLIRVSREDEEEVLGQLGEYDTVLSMAVIEHIPHTPRLFLEMLRRHVRPGGWLALDTPNLANFWYPRELLKGNSFFPDLKLQFYSSIPFEGHHREYTGRELEWMLNQIDLREVSVVYFDYNFFQYKTLSGELLDGFLAMLENPHCAGLVLGMGRAPG